MLVCTGGRKVAVTEIVEALKRKSKVILLINPNLKNEGFDTEKNQVGNAAEYFMDYMINCRKDLPKAEQLDLDFLTKYPGRALHLLRVYYVKDEEDVKSAAVRASNFLNNKTAYDYWPDKTDEIDREPGAVARKVDRNMALQHWIETGEMKVLYK